MYVCVCVCVCICLFVCLFVCAAERRTIGERLVYWREENVADEDEDGQIRTRMPSFRIISLNPLKAFP